MADLAIPSGLLPRRTSRRDLRSLAVSGAFCAVVSAAWAVCTPRLVHWFLIPVTVCGTLVGADAVEWLRGRLSRFDPVGVLGLLGLHFFFLAPLLHVQSQVYMTSVVPPPDWRTWLGVMAMLNVGGLLVYRVVRGRDASRREGATSWVVHEANLTFVASVSLVAAALLQVLVYQRFGGVTGYIASYTEGGGAAFAGTGGLLTLSESFPVVALILFVVKRRSKGAIGWPEVCVVLLAYTVLLIFFGGLRGSRSNTVWSLIWGAGIIHFWLRPLPRRAFVAGIAVLIGFMYAYGFYKSVGSDAFQVLRSGDSRSAVGEASGRDLQGVLLADLARADVQAFLVYRLVDTPDAYQPSWGRSYAGDAAILIPPLLWPNRPPGKVREGTDALYGPGSYGIGQQTASRVYGVAGEGMLAFGLPGALVGYAFLGALVGSVRRFGASLPSADARLLLYPFFVTACCVTLVGDLDNLVFFLVKFGLVPAVVVVLSSVRARSA